MANCRFIVKESEIVEVLWKQDVDLGFSLAPPKPDKSAPQPGSSKNSEDEAEKLKALQDLKDENNESKLNDEGKDDLDDEWAGIPFTIDNETGEYIRLPLQLDELLQDVLQLADLNPDEQENHQEPKPNPDVKLITEEKPSTSGSGASSSSSNVVSTSSLSDEATIVEPPQSEVEVASAQSELFNLDNADALDELDMMIQSAGSFQHHRPGQNYGTNSVFRQSGFHHHHHQSRVPLTRGVSMEQRLQDIANLFNPLPAMGVGMGVSEMSPYSHYPTHYPYQGGPAIPQHGQFPHPSHHPVLHNASLADLGATQPHYGHNLGSAVSSSMHLTNSSHETDSGASGYKMEHDMMYYSNTSSELNHTTDGFINSILNDEDLQLMDMGVSEGFCTMRMLEGNTTSNNSSVLGSSGASHGSHMLSMPTNLGNLSNEVIGASTGDRLDASSDSAVSSMGSERVPSLSDGEWGDAGSDSAQDYHQGKYGGPYDYSYNGRLGGDSSRQQPVAQKKHQMFGKRYFQEQPNIPSLPQPSSTTQPPSDHLPPVPVKYEYDAYGMHPSGAASIASSLEGAVGPIVNKDHVPLMTNAEMKYACSLDFSRPPRGSGPAHDLISHNHTYTLPQGSGSVPRPQIRDKKQKRSEDEHMTRDEKRARALNIPISVNDIINLPMDEFNERLSKYDLNETQLSLIRDIRRRGKNKVAAQNCRKRKLDQILSLEDEVKEVRRRKERLFQERDIILAERKRIASKFATLHRHVFQYLRDSDGNPCSPSQYSLQQAADGSVYLLRRENNKPENNTTTNHSGHHHHSSSQGPQPPSSSSQHQKD
ncbi:unnamed protein product [Hermetia illucens]|uniref:BZIP domain-containing protein n=1 Tax=Hermetia illucens TaxID=343691 RepID=A0A7R8UAR4_HERIL|nr:segmentation protein cap'n'collar isoform X3 [Hermetia illucens]CAD7077327.1 unnamed protein product [Hermetia illucens]